MQYNFEWNPIKAKENIRKHGVSFERAAGIFLDPFVISIFDDEHSSYEDRWITIGKDANEVVLIVIHTFHELDSDHCTVRLISARKATKTETKQYTR